MKLDAGKLEDFARSYTAAWCSGNPVRVAEFFSPSGSLAVNHGPAAVGRHAIAEVARSFMTTFPDMQVFFDRLVVHDDQAEYHWTLTGTNTGPGGSGNKVRISGFESWRMSPDGLIAASQGTFDAAEYQRQIEHGV